ncbi:hypothetical protein SYNPS1DRAFT_21091 [Syncephalis pseudoplumigaleata]|uniref:MHD domain-containing protein n=1 Tax=Syncephalis pseudoplumigaleata TaxID=1712513 RepID=A0A4P9Z477_9FUNG|nr:hypothetical protein SYNPS1DRAFT_21091 [Syncephalis pseudoplumigaleata]|eukprot:RKP27363.1 hypothetical protein SYNPS1DRAFT_21091 [Syncephalis pseudoplumigaleata]
MVYETVFLDGRRPKQVLDHFSARFKKARILHEDVAALLRERAAAEEQYAKQIQRLVRRGRAVLDPEFLGVFGELWGRIKSEWEETATLHLQFAEDLLEQVERPIRECTMNEATWLAIRQLESAAQKIAREMEDKENRLAKARKGSSTGLAMMMSASGNERRMAELAARLDELRAQWQRDASTLLLRYEAMDRMRLNNLKTSITRMQTLQSDCARVYSELLDRTLAIAFDLDPEADIARVCASSVGTSANGCIVGGGGGVYMNGDSTTTTTTSSSANMQRSTLSLPNGNSPRISMSSDNMAVHPKSATPSRSDLRQDTHATSSTAIEMPRPLSEVQEIEQASSSAEYRGNSHSTSSSPIDTPDSPRLSAMTATPNGHSPHKPERSLGLQRRITRRSSTRNPETRRASAAVDPSKFEQVARSLTLDVPGRKPSSLSLGHQSLPGSSSPLSQQEPVVYVAEPVEETPAASPSLAASPALLSKRNPFAASADGLSASSEPARSQYNPFAPAIAVQPATPSFAPPTTPSARPAIELTIKETVHAICESSGQPVKTVVHGELHGRPGNGTGEASLNELKILDADAALVAVDPSEPASLVCPLSAEQIAPMATWQLHSTGVQAAPLLVQAAWRLEANGASLAIQYRRNPHCTRLADAALRQLSFLLPLNELGGAVVQVQARPSGLWDEAQSRLLWQVDEEMPAGDATPRRILARLTTQAPIDTRTTLPPIAVRFEARYTACATDTTSAASAIGPMGVSSIIVQTDDAVLSAAHVHVHSGKYISLS